jgi:hypothetical protein
MHDQSQSNLDHEIIRPINARTIIQSLWDRRVWVGRVRVLYGQVQIGTWKGYRLG